MKKNKETVQQDTPGVNYHRENAFRPSRYLGYNRNTLAMYFIERGAYAIAESELRRAIWLNPYEPAFLANLAWCLHKQNRHSEAATCLKQAMEKGRDNLQVRHIEAMIAIEKKRSSIKERHETRD